MNIEVKAWLYDILKGIEEIEEFFSDRLNNFLTSRMIFVPSVRQNEIWKLLEKRLIAFRSRRRKSNQVMHAKLLIRVIEYLTVMIVSRTK